MSMSISMWKEIFGTALDDLIGLLAPKRIIYCEGKDKPGPNGKENGFDAKVYNKIFEEKYQETLFVSAGGNTELDQRSEIAIDILKKALLDVEIWLLKDIYNDNVKDAGSKIKNCCNVLPNINLEIFKLNLSKVINTDMKVYKELEECIFNRP
jgi:hypothetical protein